MNGIHIATGSHDNQVRYNTSISNGGGIYIIGYPAVDSLCRTDVTGNTASDNTETGISVFLCSDILITGNTCERNGKTGIEVGQAADTTVSDNTALDNLEGISVYGALGSSILNNVVSQGVCGIVVHVCDNITVEDNTVSSNTELGIQLAGRVYGTFTGNTVSDNGTGIELIGCQDSAIYNNNFIANTTQVAVTAGSTGNLFNLDRPIGGNFWSDWTGPDADGDGFVDNPYVFTGGQDNLPLADQSTWLLQELMTQIASLNLPDGIENSLNAKLRAAMQELGEGNTAAAIESLEALIHEAEAQRGKAIRTDDADALIAAVQEIISALSGT
jgi:parallel beta-helix repeat protein